METLDKKNAIVPLSLEDARSILAAPTVATHVDSDTVGEPDEKDTPAESKDVGGEIPNIEVGSVDGWSPAFSDMQRTVAYYVCWILSGAAAITSLAFFFFGFPKSVIFFAIVFAWLSGYVGSTFGVHYNPVKMALKTSGTK